jgi:hypothetical protein
MDIPFGRLLIFLVVGGLFGTIAGGYQCAKGYNYRVAAEHEATAVGRIVGLYQGKGGIAYHYVFSVNGVKMDDYSEVCETPQTRGACMNDGFVLVYYSYEPFANSRLEDFSLASKYALKLGGLLLTFALPVFALSSVTVRVLMRRNKGDDDSEPGEREGDTPSDVPDDLHIAPHD